MKTGLISVFIAVLCSVYLWGMTPVHSQEYSYTITMVSTEGRHVLQGYIYGGLITRAVITEAPNADHIPYCIAGAYGFYCSAVTSGRVYPVVTIYYTPLRAEKNCMFVPITITSILDDLQPIRYDTGLAYEDDGICVYLPMIPEQGEL